MFTIDSSPEDQYDECTLPPKPEKPYTDKKAGQLILSLAEIVEKCKALLGKET